MNAHRRESPRVHGPLMLGEDLIPIERVDTSQCGGMNRDLRP